MKSRATSSSNNPASIQIRVAGIVSRVSALPDLRTATIRAARRDITRELAGAEPESVLAIALRLLDEYPEEPYRFIAYELIHFHPAALHSLNAASLERLGAGMARWEAVDTFAPYLSGPAWREGQVPDRLLVRWAHSKDRWWRRAALVSTLALNTRARGGQGDTRRTLQVCTLLVQDRDDMVVKAMSWALRELAQRDPQAVAAFLSTHHDELTPRVLREVKNKLTTGLKQPRKADLRGT